jgi:hypothetical protein
MAKDLVKLTGLWEDTDRNGHQYFSGKINAISKVLVMPNTFKKKDSDPDYFLYLAPVEKKEDYEQKGRTERAKRMNR